VGNCLGELHAIPDGAILIRNGVIAEVGSTRRLENLAAAKGAQEIDACGRVVMPSFVDSHTHLAFPLVSGDDEYGAQRIRTATGQRIEARVRAYVEAMARHGTTTVEAKTGSGADESAECKLLRVLSALHDGPLDIVSSFLCRLPHNGDAPAALDRIESDLLPRICRRKTASFADVVCAGESPRLPLYHRYLKSARAFGFGCKIHADCHHTALAVDLAIEHKVTTIDHLEHATTEDAERIGRAGLIATVFPIPCFHNGGAQPPAKELIAAGAALAIATNFNPLHSPTLNMQTAIALASLHFGLSIEQAISAATINGAHALGRGHQVGSLEPGKIADLVVLNVSDYHEIRESLGTNVVHQTIKNGKIIYQEGQVEPRPDRPTHARL
jgi:imidazolonepropionase